MEISPSVVAPVCQAGDQLELMCTTSGALQTWQLTVISGAAMIYNNNIMRSVQSAGPSGVANSQPLIINFTITFTFSRLSTRDFLSLISRLSISSVSGGLNEVQVNCVDVVTFESAMTTILIVGGTRGFTSI